MKGITEDYVSFETAKLLKEKGFDQECDYATSWYAKQYYKNSCVGEWLEGEHQIIDDIDDKCNISYLSEKDVFIPAPTLQMAMKFLREVHRIEIHIVLSELNADNGRKYMFDIFSSDVNKSFDSVQKDGLNSYEEACEEAIKYVLENLI